MRKLATVLLAGLVGAACAASGPAETTVVPTTTTTSTTLPPDFAALCNGYLVLLRSGDPEPLRAALEDPGLEADLETMMSTEGEFEAIAGAALRVEEAVVGRCADRYSLGTTPAADDAAALQAFLEALADGDQEAAEQVAWANVVAQFTWATQDAGAIVIDGSTASMPIGPNRVVVCRAEGAVVVACRYQDA